MPSVLVTGGAGFIGSHVAEVFLDRGYAVDVLDNLSTGRRENVAFCPGLPRGIAFVGDYAVVTLSMPRHERFQGLSLEDELARRKVSAWCGVVVIDLRDGSIAEWVRLGEEFELFDVAAIPARSPTAVAPGSSDMQDAITFEDFAASAKPAPPADRAPAAAA